jgi:hypothetical protein
MVQTIKQPARVGVVVASIGDKKWIVKLTDNNEELVLGLFQVKSLESKPTIATMNGKYISQAEIRTNTSNIENVPNNWNLPSIDRNVLVLADNPERVEIVSRPQKSMQPGSSLGLNMSMVSRNVAVLPEDPDVVEMISISGTFPSIQQCHVGSKGGRSIIAS